MMIRICKKFDFDAAHFLPNVPAGHKCGRMHGHTYVVDLVLEGKPSERDGWFIDYADIAKAWAKVDALIDHRCLNEIPGLENPTTENLVPWVIDQLMRDQEVAPFLVAVRIYESATTWCEQRVCER